MKNILITGGAGFIGSNFIRYLLKKEFGVQIVNLDILGYAGSLESLKYLPNPEGHTFVQGDICDADLVNKLIQEHEIDTIIHFAAESHVDRSILGPAPFVQTNVFGTLAPDDPAFTESTAYDPRSPYSASKASSDHLVRSYFYTYGLPVTVTNCSNNYGPYQFPEKLIPLMILNATQGKPLPIYGDGLQIRDWLHVEDHCEAIYLVLKEGKIGETYNVGGGNQPTNLDLVNRICSILDSLHPAFESYSTLISYVRDRLGHDRRYAVDSSKIKKELGWKPRHLLEEGLENTVKWYLENMDWVEKILKEKDYQLSLDKNYKERGGK